MTALVCPTCGGRHVRDSYAGPSRKRPVGLTQSRPALEVDGSPAHGTVFCIDDVLPLETVVAGNAGIPARPTNERAYDMVTSADEFAFQLAVNHFAALVGPD